MPYVEYHHYVTAFAFALPRILAAFTLLPFMGKAMLGGRLTRNGVAFSLSLILLPGVLETREQIDLTVAATVIIIFKEIFLGLLLGFMAAIPFWAIESMGFIIDNQRGASMAASMNPLSGSQASPLGILFVQVCVTLFMVGGSFLLFLGALYGSFKVWPIFAYLPPLQLDSVFYFVQQLDHIFAFTVLFAGPVLIAMFFSEWGLALISRFAPQLNVFFLAMPVKSAVALLFLILYLQLLAEHLKEYLTFGGGMLQTLISLIGTL